MTSHVELTEQERTDAIAFWREYFLSGGEGRQPTPFQLDAVNDETLRDSLMFWQIGGDHVAFNPEWADRSDVIAAMVEFGESPDPGAVIEATRRLFALMREKGVETDDLDTGTVFTLMYVIWLLVGGAFSTAAKTVAKLSEVTLMYARTLKEGEHITHSEPLTGLGLAAGMFQAYLTCGAPREELMPFSAEMFGLTDESRATKFARSAVQALEEMSKETMNAKE